MLKTGTGTAVPAVAVVALLGAFAAFMGGHSLAGTKTSVVTHTRTVTVTKTLTPASCTTASRGSSWRQPKRVKRPISLSV